MDIAASIQAVTEEVVLRLARTLHAETGEENLCLAGGVALNCVANGRVLREGPFEDIWIQPAAGDAGRRARRGRDRVARVRRPTARNGVNGGDSMRGSFLGPQFAHDEIRSALDAAGAKYDDRR